MTDTDGETEQLKARIDALLTSANEELPRLSERARAAVLETEQLKTETATLKGSVEATQTAAASDLGLINQIKAEIETARSNINAEIADIVAKLAQLETERLVLKDVVTEVGALKEAAVADKEAIKTSVTEAQQVSSNLATLNTQATERNATLKTSQDALAAKIAAIEASGTKIEDLRRTLFETTPSAVAVETRIQQMVDNANEIMDDAQTAKLDMKNQADAQLKTFETDYQAIKDKILALLPSAGAAGLAYTYYDAKSKYAPTSFAGRPGGAALTGWWRYVRPLFGYNPMSLFGAVFFYVLFMVPLVGLAWFTYDLLKQLELDADATLTPEMLGLRVLIAIPLLSISAFGFTSLRYYRGLYEEYNHKQRVMELYESFKREIDAIGGEEQKQLLLNVMLNSVAAKTTGPTKEEKDTKREDAIFARIEKVFALAKEARETVT